MIFNWLTKKSSPTRPAGEPVGVRFDTSQVTDDIKADIWTCISTFEDLPVGKEKAIYEAALTSITRGRDLAILAQALIRLGFTSGRAGEIAINLNNRASSMMAANRSINLGITEARWSYSGARCISSSPPSEDECRRDASHKNAHGQKYLLKKGILIDGRWQHPGRDAGCRCVGIAIVPGFD